MNNRPYIQEVPRDLAAEWFQTPAVLAQHQRFDPANFGWSREYWARFLPPDVEPVPNEEPARRQFPTRVDLLMLAAMTVTGGGLVAMLLMWIGVIG